MNFNFQKLLTDKKNTKWLVIILMIGIGLMLLPDLLAGTPKEQAGQETHQVDRAAYEKELEHRLSDILSTLGGVSDVSVMVTLEDSGETYYARNESTDEKAAEDGGRAERTQASDGSLALKSESGGGQAPVLLKQSMPRVLGVLVTARGAGNSANRANIISAVQAVLNVPVHRVSVLEKA